MTVHTVISQSDMEKYLPQIMDDHVSFSTYASFKQHLFQFENYCKACMVAYILYGLDKSKNELFSSEEANLLSDFPGHQIFS